MAAEKKPEGFPQLSPYIQDFIHSCTQGLMTGELLCAMNLGVPGDKQHMQDSCLLEPLLVVTGKSEKINE